MLVVVQFPLGDLRSFIDPPHHRLSIPSWPHPKNNQFLRASGKVERRRLGGLDNWIGETKICNAKRACRFVDTMDSYELHKGIILRPRFRRFFFDGWASAKFELGFSVESSEGTLVLLKEEFRKGLKKLFALRLRVPTLRDGYVETSLSQAGPLLANFYLRASSSNQRQLKYTSDQLQWVQADSPVIFLETCATEYIGNPYVVTSLSRLERFGLSLSHFWVNDIRCWHMHVKDPGESSARELRISLLRLNASRVGLESVIKGLIDKAISPAPRTEASHRLQKYVDDIAPRCFQIPIQFKDCDLLEAAYYSENASLPGTRHSLIEMLTSEICMRRQVIEKASSVFETLERLKNPQLSIKEVHMGDNIVVSGQAGVVGRNGQACNSSFSQINSQPLQSADWTLLAAELETLRLLMKKEATSPVHDVAIGEVVRAQVASKERDESKVTEHLKGAGTWALECAEKVGTGVVIAALKSALGL